MYARIHREEEVIETLVYRLPDGRVYAPECGSILWDWEEVEESMDGAAVGSRSTGNRSTEGKTEYQSTVGKTEYERLV